jgi:hypothetical protein
LVHAVNAKFLIVARTILFLSLLLDTKDGELHPRLWNVFHDIYVTPNSLVLIRSQGAMLARLSDTAESWNNGPYSHILQIVNTETLAKLNKSWTNYAKVVDDSSCKKFRKALQKVYRDHYSNTEGRVPPFARSFGLLAFDSVSRADVLLKTFWRYGVAIYGDTAPCGMNVNPVYFEMSNEEGVFTTDHNATPLAIYHFGDTYQKISPDRLRESPAYPTLASDASKKQFKDWCKAFLHAVNGPDKNRHTIRFVLADPVSLCFALQQRRSSVLSDKTIAILSSPWSGTKLVFDSLGTSSIPTEFNVIDTCYLCDRVGGTNILIATIPLMQVSPASTIQMESTSRPWSEETSLVGQLLLSDEWAMSNLLGVAPLPHLTGVTNRGLVQDSPALIDFSGDRPVPGVSRIIWKIPSSGDSRVTESMKMSWDQWDFVMFLKSVYHFRFIHEQQIGAPRGTPMPRHYVMGSFTAFLAFIKPRLSIDWNKAMLTLLREIQQIPAAFRTSYQELQTQLHLHGVYTSSIWRKTPTCAKPSAFSKSTGILSAAQPPPLTCVIISVPRSVLQPIFKKCVTENTNITSDFQLRIRNSWAQHAYDSYSPLPIFGKLVMAEGGKSCKIEKDPMEWSGSSDAHFCVYVCTALLLKGEPEITSVSLNLSGNPPVHKLFQNEYGTELEIFRGNLLDERKVRLVSALPGHETPTSPLATEAWKSNDDNFLSPATTATDGSISVTHPELSRQNDRLYLTRRLNLLTDSARQNLLDSKITVKQFSPCTVNVSYGTANYLFQFPYPVNGESPTVRVARKSGWIELCAPMSTPLDWSGGYSTFPTPLSWHTSEAPQPVSWNLPAVNFSRLGRVDFASNEQDFRWFAYLQASVMSDREVKDIEQDIEQQSLLLQFKIMIAEIYRRYSGSRLLPRFRTIGISVAGETRLLIFITGVYMDTSAHNVVMDAYCLEVTPEFKISGAELPPHQQLDVDDEESSDSLLKIWKSALPAMAERCRDWDHKETCEYKTRHPGDGIWMCSCGKGKVQPDFLEVQEWIPFAPNVIRFALSPLLSEPFVEQTREQLLERFRHKMEHQAFDELIGDFEKFSGSMLKACAGCGSTEHTKKCGRCEVVYYCGRECQKKDWKNHKSACR